MTNPFAALFERRSLPIGTSSDLLSYLLTGHVSTAGTAVSETTAMNVAAVWTGVSIRARLLSTLPVEVIESVSPTTRQPALTHPARRVLLQPNSWQTGAEFRAMLEAHRLLRGNAYAWKNLGSYVDATGIRRDEITELVPLHPDQVEVVPGGDLGGPARYRYTTARGVIDLDPKEVLHLRGLSTNGLVGRSFIADLREQIGGALALRQHANALWSRDATPSVALTHPKALSDKARENLETSWEDTYGRGVDKRRVAVLEEGMEIKQLSLSPEDGQFLQTDQDLRAQIAAALLVPPHLMGLADKATSWGSGIEQQNIGLLTYTLRPDVTYWEERLTRDLVRVPERFRVKFNMWALLLGDFNSQMTAFDRGIRMGVYSPNDVRGMLDLNPVPNGDVYLQPVNYAPLGYDPARG